ncbi:helix-turn-helix domain-containing protein [Virgibacillus sp. W0181]|uniref:helix-turn-helix domain-containing protein n=1 Tax=Virgibacillus sp. W0181 TaxID=3391581 RepID=UPI003F48E495
MLQVYKTFSESITNLAELLDHPLIDIDIAHNQDTYNLMPDINEIEYKKEEMTIVSVEVEQSTTVILQFAKIFMPADKLRWEKIVSQHWEFVGFIRKADYQLKSRNLLLYTAKTLASPLRLKDVLKQILSNTLEVIEAADAGSIYFFDKAENVLVPMVTGGYNWNYIKHIRFKPNESLTGITYSTGEATIYKNTENVLNAMKTMEAKNRYYFDLAVPKDSSGARALPRDTMGAPFIIEGKCLGVIVINNYFINANFSQDDLELLVAICNQASLAIQRAQLFQEIEGQVQELRQLNDSIHQKNQLLESASNIHSKLMEIILQQKQISEMANVIADVVNNPIVIYDEHVNLLAASVIEDDLGFVQEMPSFLNEFKRIEQTKQSVHIKKADIYPVTHPLYLYPIIVANQVRGYLVIVEKNKAIKELEKTTVEQSSTVIAIELLKRESIYETEQRIRGEFLDDIETNLDVELIEKQGSYLGISDRFYYNFIGIELDQSIDNNFYFDNHQIKRLQRRIEKIILQANDSNITFNRMHGLKALVGWNKNITSEIAVERSLELVKAIQQQIEREFPDFSCSFAIGRLSTSWGEMQQSFQDTNKCMDVLHERKLPGQMMTYKEIGLSRIIMNTSQEELQQFVMDQLHPLFNYEHQNREELIKTLDIYLNTNQNLKETARTLHLHTNTLHYRLKRIEEILGLSPKDDLLQLKFAWNIMDILGTKSSWMNI